MLSMQTYSAFGRPDGLVSQIVNLVLNVNSTIMPSHIDVGCGLFSVMQNTQVGGKWAREGRRKSRDKERVGLP